jgi:Protein of unknown function (DUF3293)
MPGGKCQWQRRGSDGELSGTKAQQAGAVTPRLLRAWRATGYVVGTVLVRIGRRSAAMDALLAGIGARTGVFITAWNPLARAMAAGWNHRMQRRLSERLRRYVSLQASGSLRRWHEAHLLVAADIRPIVRLARLFRQRGVVLVVRHQAARLVLLSWSDVCSETATAPDGASRRGTAGTARLARRGDRHNRLGRRQQRLDA